MQHAPSPRPGASGAGSNTRQASADAPEGAAAATSSGPADKSTNVDELMDVVGASGVDIGAEEEGLRSTNERLQHNAALLHREQGDRSRKQTFIEPNVLADVVKKIAAAFQLRTLEPDTIPLIALAARHRLASLINDAIEARDHRRFSSHLRPPPFTTGKRKRDTEDEVATAAGEGQPGADDDGQGDDDEEELFDFDFSTGQLVTKPSTTTTKGKSNSAFNVNGNVDEGPVPAWDSLIYDDGEKLLSALERVDREEERKKRRERMLRDQKEEEERALAEAIAASEAAEREANGGESAAGGPGQGGSGTPGSAGPSTPRPGGSAGDGGDDTPGAKPKKKKKKLDSSNPLSAKNMSEDVKKRLTDQTALRSLGPKKFSWLNAGGGGAGGGFGSPSPAGGGGGLPRPKFAPASSLPPPTFAAPGAGGFGTPGPNFGGATADTNAGLFSPFGANSNNNVSASGGLSRLSHIPPLHDANRARKATAEWEAGRCIVERQDLLFVLERERGAGVGRGSGRNVLLKGRAGVIKR